MSKGPREGEYPGQLGMPFGDADDGGRAAGGPRPAAGEPRREAPADADLFEWDELRPPRREQPRRPADDARADWRVPEYPTGDRRSRRERNGGLGAAEEREEWLEPEEPRGGGSSGPEPRGGGSIGPLPERRRGPRRRRLSAGAALLAMLLGFFLAGLLDVAAIKKDVEARPYGALRSVQLALLAPMSALSGLVRADDLGARVAAALGRGEDEHHTLAEAGKARKKPLWPRAVTAAKPLRLYIAGDSMDQVFGSSLVNLSEATGLVKARNDYKVSSGLSRPDFFDWPQRMVDQIVDFRPDAVVVLFGANDGQDVYYEGKVLKVGAKAWREVYAERVGEAMDILTKGGRRVYWVGNPIMKDFGYRERIAMMNHIYEAEAAKRPGVTFVSTWKLLASERGSYTEYVAPAAGDPVLVRAPDGIHLTRAGGDLMAGRVLDVIEKDWGMGAAPSAAP